MFIRKHRIKQMCTQTATPVQVEGVGGATVALGIRRWQWSTRPIRKQPFAQFQRPCPRHRRPEARKEGLNAHLLFPLHREGSPHPGVSSTSIRCSLMIHGKNGAPPTPPVTDCTSDRDSLGSCLSVSSRASPSIQYTPGA